MPNTQYVFTECQRDRYILKKQGGKSSQPRKPLPYYGLSTLQGIIDCHRTRPFQALNSSSLTKT